MTDLPNIKIKALVSFPPNAIGGTGIDITKTAGHFIVNLDYSEFAFSGTLPPNTNVLVWDTVNNVYTLVPPSATSGITDAPSDSKMYGRQNAIWTDAWASPALTGNPTSPTPTAGDNDTSIATTAFVAAAVAAVPGGDVVGPAGAVADRIAVFNGTTGKIIKDGGSTIAAMTISPATVAPLNIGTAAVGTSLLYARQDHVHAYDATAWTNWTPTFAMATTGSTPITAAVAGGGARYKQIGKTVFYAIDAAISNIGVGNGASFLVSLPVAAWGVNAVATVGGKEVINTGKLLTGQLSTTTTIGIIFYDNNSLISGGNGVRIQAGGQYEAA